MQDLVFKLSKEIEDARAVLSLCANILGDDTEAKRDTVEGETQLHEMLRYAMARVLECETMVASLKTIEKRVNERRKRLEGQADSLRTVIQLALEVGELPKFETDIGKALLAATAPSLLVTDEFLVPPEFWKRKDPELDKRALLAEVKAAHANREAIPGATLTEPGQTLSLRFS
jgi:hypothetical protein